VLASALPAYIERVRIFKFALHQLMTGLCWVFEFTVKYQVKVKQGEQVEQFEDDAIEQEDSDAFTDDEDDEDDEDSDF